MRSALQSYTPSVRLNRAIPVFGLFFSFFSALFLIASALPAQGQQFLEGEAVVNGEIRSYALYIPSTYDSTQPNSVILALHPLNTARWDAESWRDTLSAFAEEVGAILVCPDGGSDGSLISEETDTLLATGLLNQVALRYKVDSGRVYAMGFSIGGAATYLYGLANPWRFAGYLPIGAAINGTSEMAALLPNAAGKPVYIVHGAEDAPQTRFYPAVEGLQQNGAVVQTLLMQGVGHTIDFPNRNAILATAFRWIDSVNRAGSSSGVREGEENDGNSSTGAILYPNPLRRDQEGTFRRRDGFFPRQIRVIDLLGNERRDADVTLIDRSSAKILPRNLPPGVYFLEFRDQRDRWTIRFVIQQ